MYKFSEQLNENKQIPEVIEIDGLMKPTKNSNDDLISDNIEHIYNFYKWFGDSKIVDDIGRPLVCYHLSYKNFDVFKPGIFGKMGAGIYFYTFREDVLDYRTKKLPPDKILYECYVKSEKLMELKNPFSKRPNIEHDGIQGFRGYRESELKVYESKQIKSIKNDGSFDINDDNIYS